jgi:salicylate hydroxylase
MMLGIIGAGIGGLTAALACRRAGIDVRLFDQAPALEEVGAGLQLGPNAVRVLRALGLSEALARFASRPEAIHFRDAHSGRLLAHLTLGPRAEQRYGAPYYHVHRADLQAALLEAAADVGIEPVLDARCVRIAEGDGNVTAGFQDGRLVQCDVLIGADGIRSFVRQHLFGSDPARFTGKVAFRGTVRTSALGGEPVNPVVTAWLGPHRHFVSYFVRGGELVNYVAVIEDESWRDEAWDIPAQRAELTRHFGSWHAEVRGVIEATESCHKWALHDRDPLNEWSRGRVALLGDACHPMLPFLAQGAAMAIEDGYTLAAMLAVHSEDPAAGIEGYVTRRRARATRVQRESRRQGELYHLERPLQVATRNAVLGIGSRLLPGIAMRRYDWLFGFDAVTGLG